MDPEGYYARLGVAPTAGMAAIAAAFRRKARVLHPDVPVTGDAASFIRLHEAYEVLGDETRRARYDRDARNNREARNNRAEPVRAPMPDAPVPDAYELPPMPDFPELPVAERTLRRLVVIGLAALGAISVVELALHVARMVDDAPPGLSFMLSRPPDPHPSGPAPVAGPAAATAAPPLAATPDGAPTHFVLPSAGPAPLWRFDEAQHRYLTAGHLPPFTGVAVLDTPPRDGMVEVRVTQGRAFVDATRLTPGDASAARRAYCGYNAGPPLAPGEVIARHGAGEASLSIRNVAGEPLVVSLRGPDGAAGLRVAAAPGVTTVAGLPAGPYAVDYVTGTLWSRACGSFVAGQRAWRLAAPLQLAGAASLTVPAPDAAEVPPDSIPPD